MSGEKGGVPEGWREVRVRDIAKIGRGRVISHKEIEENPGPYPVYSSQTSNNGEMGKLASFDFEGDYITWTTDGANAGTVFQRRGRFNCTNVCGTLKISPNENFQYLGYYLSTVAKQYVSTQLANPKLMNGVMAEIPILLPPLPEQRKIAAILSTWDESLATLTNLLAAKRQQKRGLVEALLTGEKRLSGFVGEWEEKKLGDVFEVIRNGLTYDAKGTGSERITRIETISDGTVNLNRVGYFNPKSDASQFLLEFGDILFSHINSLAHIGKVARFDDPLGQKVYHGMNLLMLRANAVNDSHYLFELLQLKSTRQFVRTVAKKAINQASVSIGDLKGFGISVPPLPEQQAIASILSTLDGEIASLEALRAKVQEQKRGLMDELLTGRVRVQVEE